MDNKIFVSRWTPRWQHYLYYSKSGIVRRTLWYCRLSVEADLTVFGLLHLHVKERCGVQSVYLFFSLPPSVEFGKSC